MKHKFGDKVRVRSWESMASEYGVTVVSKNEDFNCQKEIPNGYGFIYPVMEYFCEQEVTISFVGDDFYEIEEESGYDGNAWEDWMFEEVGK